MNRIFKDSGITAEGKILPLEKFRLFLDIKEKKVDPKVRAELLARAETALAEPIPSLTLSDYRSYYITGSRAPFDPKFQRRRTMMVELAMGEIRRISTVNKSKRQNFRAKLPIFSVSSLFFVYA